MNGYFLESSALPYALLWWLHTLLVARLFHNYVINYYKHYKWFITQSLTCDPPTHYISYNKLIFYSDIDECVQGLAGCDHNCNNTAGAYFCTCTDGYELESDNHTCTGMLFM